MKRHSWSSLSCLSDDHEEEQLPRGYLNSHFPPKSFKSPSIRALKLGWELFFFLVIAVLISNTFLHTAAQYSHSLALSSWSVYNSLLTLWEQCRPAAAAAAAGATPKLQHTLLIAHCRLTFDFSTPTPSHAATSRAWWLTLSPVSPPSPKVIIMHTIRGSVWRAALLLPLFFHKYWDGDSCVFGKAKPSPWQRLR